MGKQSRPIRAKPSAPSLSRPPLWGHGQAAPEGVLPEPRPKGVHGSNTGNGGGRFVSPPRGALCIGLGLGEDAAQAGPARLGAASGVLAGTPDPCLLAPGHPGGVRAAIQLGPRAPARRSLPRWPSLGRRAHPLDQALNWPRRHRPAAGFQELFFGRLVAGFIGSRPAPHARQRRGGARFPTPRRRGRIMPRRFAGRIVVVARQGEGAEQTLALAGFPSLAGLARRGLIGRIHSVGGPLQEKAPQRGGGLEERGAPQPFPLLDGPPGGVLPLQRGHHLLDFLVLGQEEVGRGVFFFEPACRCARVCWTRSSTYCWTNCWKRW